jgi:hypothetical protein
MADDPCVWCGEGQMAPCEPSGEFRVRYLPCGCVYEAEQEWACDTCGEHEPHFELGCPEHADGGPVSEQLRRET